MREEQTPEKELAAVKYQLAQLAYDIFSIRINRAVSTAFDELSTEYKAAWSAGVWAAIEASKNKTTKITEAVSTKQQDNGYLLYAGCKEIKKSHMGAFTYSKFSDNVKQMYRDLATKLYTKMDADDEEML